MVSCGVDSVDSSIPLGIFPIKKDRLCICFCGLPGRGKTLISRRLGSYLSFFHALHVKIFNVGEYRRRLYGASKNAEWFDVKNAEALRMRAECNNKAVADMTDFFRNNLDGLAILDATNSRHSQRSHIQDLLRQEGIRIMFVEVLNEDPTFLVKQYEAAAKTMPDYADFSSWEAEADYRQRIASYNDFESLNAHHPVESKWSFIKCDHSSHYFEIHNIQGHIPMRVVHFLTNIRTTTHSFYVTRHGQSEYNRIGRIGGDSGLSRHGIAFAKALAKFVREKITFDEEDPDKIVPVRLWTSTLRRTVETAQFIERDVISVPDQHDPSIVIEWEQLRMRKWPYLDEIFAGTCDGMTYSEIKNLMPDEFSRREKDKLTYRYPRGESYLDVIARLEPIIIEMERHREPVLIIGHLGILRVLIAFYKGLPREECPHVKIPQNTVIRLRPTAVSCDIEEFKLCSSEDFEGGDQDEL